MHKKGMLNHTNKAYDEEKKSCMHILDNAPAC